LKIYYALPGCQKIPGLLHGAGDFVLLLQSKEINNILGRKLGVMYMNAERKVVIIGGGVAGLSAAIHLAECGIKPVLIEAGDYPAHKLCGEFLPEIMLRNISIFSGSQKLVFPLPQPAGSISRFYFDNQLVQIARSMGCQILTKTSALSIETIQHPHHHNFMISLSSGETITADQLIIGTGRVASLLSPTSQSLEPKSKTQQPRYMGFKAHFSCSNNELLDQLASNVLFYTFPGAYLGISLVQNDQNSSTNAHDRTINIACLAKISATTQNTNGQIASTDYIQSLLDQTALKNNVTQRFTWITSTVPEFGIRHNQHISPALRSHLGVGGNIFFIGDAAGTIPPASGDGLGIALTSGKLLVPFVISNDAAGFQKAWVKKYAPIIKMGKILHTILINPTFTKIIAALTRAFPSIARTIFAKTRS
jgi:2-polyprenyl-6-methoxyphenol hydroxylase-like FAD-dependent oxidoreductase